MVRSPSRIIGIMNLGSAVCLFNAAWNSFCKLFGVGAGVSARSLNLGVHIYIILKKYIERTKKILKKTKC